MASCFQSSPQVYYNISKTKIKRTKIYTDIHFLLIFKIENELLLCYFKNKTNADKADSIPIKIRVFRSELLCTKWLIITHFEFSER